MRDPRRRYLKHESCVNPARYAVETGKAQAFTHPNDEESRWVGPRALWVTPAVERRVTEREFCARVSEWGGALSAVGSIGTHTDPSGAVPWVEGLHETCHHVLASLM